VAAYEVLVATAPVRNLISEGKTNQLRNSLLTGHKDGMVTFEKSLSQLVRSGQVTYQDALTPSLYPKDVESRPRQPSSVSA
jgi:twitching motility protein PilT